MTNVSKLIKIYASINDLTGRQMAKQLGLTHTTTSRILKGEKMSSQTMLTVINWLFTKDTKENV